MAVRIEFKSQSVRFGIEGDPHRYEITVLPAVTRVVVFIGTQIVDNYSYPTPEVAAQDTRKLNEGVMTVLWGLIAVREAAAEAASSKPKKAEAK